MEVNKIFNIESEKDFQSKCLEIFCFQYFNNPVYKEYVDLLEISKESVDSIEKIPFLPISFFKSKKIYVGNDNYDIIFSSSATTGVSRASHFVKDISIYERSFFSAFKRFYGDPEEYIILCLLPSYLEREGSSLVYMAEKLVEASNSPNSGFFLYDHQELYAKIKEAALSSKKILLLGVSFALLDFAAKFKLDGISNLVIMETGGMKGRGEEIPREKLHEILKDSFGVDMIHSEYGMCELLSQAYSEGGGVFRCPPWMRVLVRDINRPFSYVEGEGLGGINIIDLANINSCCFIETEDIGRSFEDGLFAVDGRLANVEIRGCNMLL